jgi:hypothetical protein
LNQVSNENKTGEGHYSYLSSSTKAESVPSDDSCLIIERAASDWLSRALLESK